MTTTQAREKRRQVIGALHEAMGVISKESFLTRSMSACDAMATAYQSIGRLIAIDEQEAVSEQRSQGQPARSPKPSIIPNVIPTNPACENCGHTTVKMSDHFRCFDCGFSMDRSSIMPEITREMEVDSSFRLAWEAAFMTGETSGLEFDESHEHIVASRESKPCG